MDRLPLFALCGAQLTSLLFSAAFLYVSSLNYPGGEAFARFHSLIPPPPSHPTPPVRVHLSNLACISGVTRYGERVGGHIQYSKEEGMTLEELSRRNFDWLIEEAQHVDGYELAQNGTVEGLTGVDWRRGRALLKPQLYVMRKKEGWEPNQRVGEHID